MPLKGTKHGVFIQSFIILGKTFSEYLAYELLHRPDSWQDIFHIFLLSFPLILDFLYQKVSICISAFPRE